MTERHIRIETDELTAYVRLELASQDAAATYPDLAFAIETSVEVTEAYHVELRRQTRDLAIEQLDGTDNRKCQHN